MSASRAPATRAEQPLLEVRGLCVDYGTGPDAVHAVTDADLTLHRGEVLGLAGESGSGKSTLAYAITRLLRAPGVITGGERVGYRPGPAGTVDLLAADDGRAAGAALVADRPMVMQSAMNALNPVLSIGPSSPTCSRRTRRTMSKRGRAGPGPPSCCAMVGITADRLRQPPARAVRRHAAARDDRDGARPASRRS